MPDYRQLPPGTLGSWYTGAGVIGMLDHSSAGVINFFAATPTAGECIGEETQPNAWRSAFE